MVERLPHSLGEQRGSRHARRNPRKPKREPQIGRAMLTTTQRMSHCMSQFLSCAIGGALIGKQHERIALVLIAGAAVAACQTVSGSPTTEADDNLLAASPANIASLTGVVQSNPNDPQAYNMRGSVFGQAGRNAEALADFNKAVSLD